MTKPKWKREAQKTRRKAGVAHWRDFLAAMARPHATINGRTIVAVSGAASSAQVAKAFRYFKATLGKAWL